MYICFQPKKKKLYVCMDVICVRIYIYICRWWQTYLVVLVVYSAWASPFELAFKKVATGSLMVVDLIVDSFFAIDIILTFFVAYLDKTTYLLVDDHKKIAVRYIIIIIIIWIYMVYFISCTCIVYFF